MSKPYHHRPALPWLVAALLVLLPASAPVAAAEDEVITSGNIAYVSGGTGAESRERLAELSRKSGFNVKLLFVLQGGDYLSAVDVRIADRAGKVLLQTKSEGPIFLAKMPAGNYDFFATFEGRELKQRMSVAAGKPTAITFRWPAAAAK